MDPLDYLPVRFHFGGEFLNDGKKLHYVGGNEEVSFIEREKISLPEVMGHLKDHFNATDPVLLHWLFPGKNLRNGLRALVDDRACLDMSACITDGGAADIFVELVVLHADDQCSQPEDAQMSQIRTTYSSPEQVKKDLVGVSNYLDWIRDKEGANKVVKARKLVLQEEVSVQQSAPMQVEQNSDTDDLSDEDYVPGDPLPCDDESSEEDEEAVQIRADLMDFKKKMKARSVVVVDGQGHEVNVEILMASKTFATNLNDEGIGHNRTSCSRRTGRGDQGGGASQPSRGSGGASQPSRGSGGPSQPLRGSPGATQPSRGSAGGTQQPDASHSRIASGGATQSKRKSSNQLSASTGSSKRHCSQLSVGSNDGKKALNSSTKVSTTLKHGAQAKVTLQATAPGMSGKHSKASVQISGPSRAKVVVSATGAQNRKRSREGGASGSNDKGNTSSTLLLRGPGP